MGRQNSFVMMGHVYLDSGDNHPDVKIVNLNGFETPVEWAVIETGPAYMVTDRIGIALTGEPGQIIWEALEKKQQIGSSNPKVLVLIEGYLRNLNGFTYPVVSYASVFDVELLQHMPFQLSPKMLAQPDRLAQVMYENLPPDKFSILADCIFAYVKAPKKRRN